MQERGKCPKNINCLSKEIVNMHKEKMNAFWYQNRKTPFCWFQKVIVLMAIFGIASSRLRLVINFSMIF